LGNELSEIKGIKEIGLRWGRGGRAIGTVRGFVGCIVPVQITGMGHREWGISDYLRVRNDSGDA
jgi:hypothetical protein